MADNVTLDPGAGGAVIATDDDATAHHQYVKVEFGGDGTFTKVTTAVGLPTDPLDRAARDCGKIDIAMGQAAHDAAATTFDPVLIGGYANAAAPADVSLDVDAVRAWYLRNGAAATVVTAAGALIGGDATNGLDVDVTRVTGTVTVAGTVTANIGTAGTLSLEATQGSVLTAVQLIDDTIKVLGTDTYTETTTKGSVIGVVRRDADTSPVGTDNEIGPLTMDANGRLKVEVFSGETLPVSGTVTANAGSGTFTVSGTVTANIGTSGSLNLEATQTSVLTAVQLIDDPVQVLGTDTYTEATSKGMTLGAVRRDADTTLVNTTNEFSPLQVDANGRLKVEAFSGETLPVSGTVTANLGTIAGVATETTLGSVLTSVQLQDDTVATLGTTTYSETTTKGTTIGAVRRDAATSPVGTDNEIGPLTMSALGALKITPQPDTTGGLTIFRSLDLDETEEDVKTSAGMVYSMWVTNTATATRWVKFYNDTAANVIVGTTTPVITFGIPGNSSDDVSGLFGGTHGIQFGTAICVAATTGVADADTGAPGANDVIVNIFYK